jgi:hypothetical protein
MAKGKKAEAAPEVDRRMALTDKEVEAKDFLLAQMKKHGKLKYVQRVPEGELLKVKITDED